MEPVRKAVKDGKPDLGFFRLETEAWKNCENISVDYAVMEKAQNLVVVPFSNGWTDLGGWNAVWQEMGPDENGVAILNMRMQLNVKIHFFVQETIR